jgi:thioredoxin 1
MAKNIVNLTDDNFDREVLKSDLPVLVDFWAPWCGPCKMLTPIIEQVAGAFEGEVKVAKLNTDESLKTASSYDIRSIPTVMLFDGGHVVETLVGMRPRDAFIELLENHLKSRGAPGKIAAAV